MTSRCCGSASPSGLVSRWIFLWAMADTPRRALRLRSEQATQGENGAWLGLDTGEACSLNDM